MKKQSLKKAIAVVLAATSIFALSATGASAAWRQDSRGWWNTEGNSYSKGWRNIGGTWYHFDNNGYMKTGWLNNGGWYYFSPSGAMQTGWIQAGGYWYYLKSNGVMAIGTVVTDGKISKFDITGKWLGYANSTQTNTSNNQQTNVTNNSNNQGNTTSTTRSSSNTQNVDNEQEIDTASNNNNQINNTQTSINNTQQANIANSSNAQGNANHNSQRNNNSNITANNTQTSINNTQQVSTANNSSNQSNINLNNSSTNTSANQSSSNNQETISNEVNREFTIEDAIKMISDYKGIAVTLTPPGPTSGIDGAYEKIHKDGKVGYNIYSYLFNGKRADNSGAILIFENGDYKQFLQGHHPSLLDSDEWIEEKELEDAALKDFLSHGQPANDGSYVHYYLGKRYSFGFMQGMEQGTIYRIFHASEFDRNGYRIETAADYMESANIRNN